MYIRDYVMERITVQQRKALKPTTFFAHTQIAVIHSSWDVDDRWHHNEARMG
jgi:hypothetical protein